MTPERVPTRAEFLVPFGQTEFDDAATAADLFELVRGELVGLFGSTPVAILLRRAQARAASTRPGLREFAVERVGMGYRYRLPCTWSIPSGEAEADLAALTESLLPLLEELVGRAGADRLGSIQALRARGII